MTFFSEPAPRAWQPAELAVAVATVAAPVPIEPVLPVLSPQEEADQLREAMELARAEGFAAGRLEGLAEGRRIESDRLADVHAMLEEVAVELRAGEARWTAAARENVTALAIAVAGHIVGREVRSDAAAIAELVRRALTEFPLDEPIRVRLNPQDLSAISANAAARVPIGPGREIRWVADPALRSGGCVVEGRERIVDGRVDRALERLYEALSDD